ncbi:formate C-acetyltransferase [Serratia fonticola]|uniref:4-hydroxyphenylacetate decarboxylase large subunit n=1 Tax=Serratia fonticola TaxID=47917 RepID=A0A3S4WPK3_SERFO|nr:formate C-acetyltransferase [Serratia fonticola]CAI1118763.1 4-hydroxyphenylacetate decarboxylase large subunit [Serratia fonticola]CAI1745228.1 4-hydroxyphenylacetate decarboxylase large subunit [Serratia fonticola]CAI1964320.1 4-hydroxyphenylacetate decarboxylase large subunit [Serratia fonticola]CAI2028345.1 4-hydroxyphenylacetate decarboxylase large subunit [Serratia fonticola]VEI62401.1 4-hydroxyphenylacetate decarboxylase large subunit [Serratia fonticola]
MLSRIERLKAALFSAPREISLERALLYTASHRQTEGEPTIIRRAKATAYILDHVAITLREDELIAGNRTVKPRAGIVSPEMDPYWLLKELDAFPTRPQDRFAISEADKQVYREQLYPYWEKRSMKDFINGQMSEEVKTATQTQIFSVNQTDKGQGHIIIDYPRLLNNGLDNLLTELQSHAEQQPDNAFYAAALLLLQASQRHILRYASLARQMAEQCSDETRRAELLRIAEISSHNAHHKPQDFYQACQLFWYMNIILQYESNASSLSLGRFDQYMLPFYQASLNQGQDPAFLKELLESLWVKCNDIVLLRSTSSARYFAGFPTGYTILLGGLTETGRSAVNVLSFLCLDAYQNIRLPQPNLGVRVNEFIDRPFLLKTAETIRLGTGIPQIFNDEVVVPAFLNRGVSLEDARDYAVVGCVELSIPGRTYGLHDIAMFNLLKVMELTLLDNEGNASLTYPQLLDHIREKIRHYVRLMAEGSNICDIGHRDWAPVPLLSSFIDDCLQHGKDITEGGARYNFSGVQGIGIANLSDSLFALKGLVFDQQRLSFDELLATLKSNFATPEGEKIRARLINRFDKYGNDIDEVDLISADLLRFYCKEVEQYRNPRGGQFTPGSYTVSAHVPLGAVVGATPDGRYAGEQLADGGLSPMLGQDGQGPTAVLKSVSKLDNYLLSNGTLLNVKFTPSTLEGQQGLNKLADFLGAFTKLKLQHVQFNVVNAETLKEAQARPQDFAGLVVRVAGYSAFFVELSKEIQDDIIRRTAHQL